MGNWFEISYPADFSSNPSGPIEVWEGIEYIETDEATFVSENGEVEFFVFSPQWSGEPKDYLIAKENEEILDEKIEEKSSESYSKTKLEIIFKDKADAYTRKAESTREFLGDSELHLVFGIKYKNTEVYDKYQKAYEDFKTSLIQFAD